MRRLTILCFMIGAAACSESATEPELAPEAPDLTAALTPGSDFDIYVHNARSGRTRRVTRIAGADEFNPSFSHNGRFIVHDVVSSSSHDLYVTNVRTGVSTFLVAGGNDADWSPTGGHIAFDRFPAGDLSIYLIRPRGGATRLLRSHATDPHWGPRGRLIAFTDATDGSIRTLDVATGSENIVAQSGIHPAWSHNGEAIAFSDGLDLFMVKVDRRGAARGAPVQLTFDAALNQQPTWSTNNKTIAFHRDSGGFDFDIWTISASGGTPTRLVGSAGSNDFDPNVYNSKLVAFAGFALPPAPKR